MVALRIRHRTVYCYNYAVSLGPHRLMLRPRESRDLRLLRHDISVFPDARLTSANDVFGNTLTTAHFIYSATELVLDSVADVEIYASALPVFEIAEEAVSYPFRYSNDEWTDLAALTVPQYPDPHGRLLAWAKGFVAAHPTPTLALLKDLSTGVAEWSVYEQRDMEGTQSPIETLNRRRGSCRDFAVLFVEAARSLGFGARLVSGYLYTPNRVPVFPGDPGSTHAWAEIYVPGAGWITFDPTNRSVGGHNLIPVAVARTIAQATPVSGSYLGPANAFSGMSVGVTVTPLY